MAKMKCTEVILNFGPRGKDAIDDFRKNMFIEKARIVLKREAPDMSFNDMESKSIELGMKAYNSCEFEEFDDENGFYTFQEYKGEQRG